MFDSDAAADWLACSRRSTSRTAAASSAPRRRRCSSARPPTTSSTGGDALTDQVAATIREWAGQARERGVAAVFEAAQLAGMDERVLRWRGGERAHDRPRACRRSCCTRWPTASDFNLPALRDWLRRQREERSGPDERNRRLDSDAAAVQIMTVWGSKGLQFPIVYLPFAFNRHVRDDDLALFHDERHAAACTSAVSTARTAARSRS